MGKFYSSALYLGEQVFEVVEWAVWQDQDHFFFKSVLLWLWKFGFHFSSTSDCLCELGLWPDPAQIRVSLV